MPTGLPISSMSPASSASSSSQQDPSPPPTQQQQTHSGSAPTLTQAGRSADLPYSKYDIIASVPACPVTQANQTARFHSLRDELESLISGAVLVREDQAESKAAPPTDATQPPMPSPSAIAPGASSSSAAAAQPHGVPTQIPGLSGIETFTSTTRIFNSAAPIAAHLVTLPQTTQDVAAILKFCIAHSLSPSVKSGGYATAGWAVQGDVVLDMSRMNAIDVIRPEAFWAARASHSQEPKLKKAKAEMRPEPVRLPSSTSRIRKADEAFASSGEAAQNPLASSSAAAMDVSSSSEDPSVNLEQARKRLSPSVAPESLHSPLLRRVAAEDSSYLGPGASASSLTASRSGSGSAGSGTSGSAADSSREGTTHSGITDASSEPSSHDPASDAGHASISKSAPPLSASPAPLSSMASASLPARTAAGPISGSNAPTQLRTGLAEHLIWQRHHRPDGRASTHERVVLPESGPFVWRAADEVGNGAHGTSAPGAAGGSAGTLTLGTGSSSGDSLPFSGSPTGGFGIPSSASSSSSSSAATAYPGSGMPSSQFITAQQQYPFTTPPSALHDTARAPSALLPTHSHEQPWQEARFRQQIAESADHHHRQSALWDGRASGIRRVNGFGGGNTVWQHYQQNSMLRGDVPATATSAPFANSTSALLAGRLGSTSGSSTTGPREAGSVGGSDAASAAAAAAADKKMAAGGYPPIPTGLASFMPPFNLSPDAIYPGTSSASDPNYYLQQQQQQHPSYSSTNQHASNVESSSAGPPLAPGIYTRPYLLAVFGPGIGVRALDLATDEAGRTNSWDRDDLPLRGAAESGSSADKMMLDPAGSNDVAKSSDGSEPMMVDGEEEVILTADANAHGMYVPKTPDWDPPMRSTPYHCPLSAYPVGSTAMTTGGFGYISRAYGLSLDNLVEVEMVLADGRVVILNEGSKERSREEADLWWAVRGAAPCFGVVTRIVAKAYPVPSCFSGNLIFPFNPITAPSLIKHWRDCLKGVLPREMYTNLILVAGPNPSAHVIMIQICLLQSAAEGETFVQAIASWTGERMLLKDVEERPFLAQQDGVAQVLKGGGGRRWMIRGDTLDTLTDELIGQSVVRFKSATANRGVWLFELVNGAIADNADEEEEEGETGNLPGLDTAAPGAGLAAAAGPGRFTIPPVAGSGGGTGTASSSSTDPHLQRRPTKETCLASSLRKAHFMVGALQQWDDHEEDQPCVVSVDGWLRDAVLPVSIGGPLPSFLERSETRERIASTFGAANLDKLIDLKRRVDPAGLFRHTFGAGLTKFASAADSAAAAATDDLAVVEGAVSGRIL
ncbi:hypothetical protein OC861_002360 [Tilletia horrida]|nr:hypothetical protein OC861_002360 [Tilletia horrida]